jgi:hypothetical protein
MQNIFVKSEVGTSSTSRLSTTYQSSRAEFCVDLLIMLIECDIEEIPSCNYKMTVMTV